MTIGQSSKTRREVLKATSAVVSTAAAATLAPMLARAQGKTIKIGYVTPVTGQLAFFAEADAYVVPQFRQAMAQGVKIGSATYQIELVTRDS